jgi:hypothetical protein
MPNFLNIWSAAIAAGVAVPLLLLLYFLKLRRREVMVSSTLLWKRAVQDLQVNAPFQRLRRNLLLFLQMLILLALLLALSRPVMNYAPGAGKVAVILIDRSASMSAVDQQNQTPRLDEAKRKARELVDTMDREGSAMVIAFDDSAEVVRSFTTDRTILKQAIDSIQPTHRRSKLKLAYQLAEAKAAAFYVDQLRPTQNDRPEIYLFSDGRILDATELSLKQAELKQYFKIGNDQAANVGIVAMNAKRNYERPSEVQVFVRLANYGPNPSGAVLQLSVDGQVPAGGIKRDFELLPERWDPAEREKAQKERKLAHRDSAEFRLDLMKGAVVRVELKEQTDDALAADDSARVVVPPPRPLNVLLVSSKGNFWLERFLESAKLKKPGIITAADYEERIKDPQAVASQYDVIFFDRYSPKVLPPTGNFFYFAAVPPDSKLKVATDAKGAAMMLADQVVLDWDRNHAIMRVLNLRFYVSQALKLSVPLDAQVLVDGVEGPLIVLYREDRRTHLVFAFDVNNSDWPTVHPSFPVFMDNALQYLALGSEMNVRQSYAPGATPRIPRYNLQQAGADVKQVVLSGPPSFQAVKIGVPPTGDFALPPLEKVGLYTLDPPIPQFEKLAVNLLDENESNLVPAGQVPGGGGTAVEAAATGKSRLELWWWIVAAGAVPLCLIEWWIYTRRVHL